MFARSQMSLVGGALALALLLPCTALAAPSGNSPAPSSNVNYEDLYYDFELYWIHDVTRYYVVAEFEDGHEEEYEFLTEQAANDYVAWLYFHIVEVEYAYVEKGTKTVTEYVGTYDTRSEAKHWGLSLPGSYEIVRVSAFRSNTTTSSPTR